MIDKTGIDNHWNYFLSLEDDLSNTSQFIEPKGQENTYSFAFSKILILSCTEIETVLKELIAETENNEKGNIGEYKAAVLQHFPNIVIVGVEVPRLEKTLTPFAEWSKGKLTWWDAYTDIKHNRGKSYTLGTYNNAVTAMAALYVLIFYLSKVSKTGFDDYKSKYFSSSYCHQFLLTAPEKELPDFDVAQYPKTELHLFTEKTVRDSEKNK